MRPPGRRPTWARCPRFFLPEASWAIRLQPVARMSRRQEVSGVTIEQTQALTGVSEVLEPVIAALGLDLYDVELTGPASGRILRVSIDRDGGVDLDAITEVTQALAPVLDTDEVVAG